MDLLELPDDVLLVAFDQLTPNELPSVRLVCKRFDFLALYSAHRRQSITILVGRDALEKITKCSFNEQNKDMFKIKPKSLLRIKPSHIPLSIRKLTHKTVRTFISWYPNITSLEIAIGTTNSFLFDRLIQLLQNCSAKLVTLKLFLKNGYYSNNPFSPTHYDNLVNVINTSMPMLRHLTIDFGPLYFENHNFDMPVLQQLTQFNFYSGDFQYIAQSVYNYGQANEELDFKIHEFILDNQNLEQLLQTQPALARRFSSVNINTFPQMSTTQLERFTSRFTSLTSLALNAFSPSLVAIANQLTPLKQLIYLKLTFDDRRTRLNFSADDDTLDRDQIGQFRLLKMVHVYLDFQNYLPNHEVFHSRHFGWVFPNVRIVKVDFSISYCGLCGDASGTKSCIRQMLQSCGQCFKLRYVETRNEHGKCDPYFIRWLPHEL